MSHRTLLVFVVLLIVTGCHSSQPEIVKKWSGSPSGTFYSLAILHRFEKGETLAIKHGKELYRKYCEICHGETGDGNGFNAYNLKSNFNVQPFDFTDSTAVKDLTFEEVKKAIAHGGTAVGKSQYMPPWSNTLTDYDLECVSRYVWNVLASKQN
ncbi:MAG: cytochrome c [Calditrichaeota bacterium]|nr:MAG: cytochrome c [Calditrichota bacterium]